MSLFCQLRKDLTSSISFYSQPDSSSSFHQCSSDEIQSDDYLLCIERHGIWLHCHTRHISGWIHGNLLQPVTFPSAYIINDDLPNETQICLRTHQSDSKEMIGSLVTPGTIIFVLEIQNNWLKILDNGKEVWLKREVLVGGEDQNHRVVILAIPIIPKLYEKSSSLPSGCSLRLRDEPLDNANITRLSQCDSFLAIQTQGNWIQVLVPSSSSSSSSSPSAPLSPEWMLTKTSDGIVLLQESKKRMRLMCLQQDIAQEAILRIRETPEASGVEVGALTYWDIFPVWSMEGIWAYTFTDLWDGFVLSASGNNIFLQTFIPNYPAQHSRRGLVPPTPSLSLPLSPSLCLPLSLCLCLPLSLC
jgi:hypothetical protein